MQQWGQLLLNLNNPVNSLSNQPMLQIKPSSSAVVHTAGQHGAHAPPSAKMCELLSGQRLREAGVEMKQVVGLG